MAGPDAAPLAPAAPAAATGWARLWGPPGVLFLLATAAAILVGLDANSRLSFFLASVAYGLWMLIAWAWLIRFAGAAWTRRLRFPMRHWVRWLAVPVTMAIAFWLTRTDVPFDLRLRLSRPAMDQAAAEVMAGGSTERGWIGLYPVSDVERIPNGVRFLVVGADFIDMIGFAYSTDSRPQDPDGDYEPLGDGWWLWYLEF